MKALRKIRSLFALFAAVCMIFAMSAIPAFATETGNQAVLADRNAVLQILVCYTTDDGTVYLVQGGSAFLINDSTLVTANHVLQLSDDTTQSIADTFSVAKKDVNKKISYKVSVIRDQTMDVETLTNSSQLDFAVMRIKNNQTISGRTYLKIRSSQAVNPTETCYSLGFPAITSNLQDASKYTSSDVTITSGQVNRPATINGVDYLVTSAHLSDGNSGGPLVDEDGNVIGVNVSVSGQDNSYGYAVQTDELMETLDSYSVDYTKADNALSGTSSSATEATTVTAGTTTETTEQQEETVDKSALETAINSAEKVDQDTSGYTDESVSTFEDALKDARSVNNSEAATQAEVDSATSTLTQAQNGLAAQESSLPIPLPIIIIIAAAAVVLIIIIILVVKGSKKPNQTSAPSSGPAPTPTPGPTPMDINPVPPTSYPGSAGTSVLGGGAGQTTVLGGAGETTVLNANLGTLTRKKNGENISINKEQFKIGRDRSRVDYCISDNTAVGRLHAIIVNRGGSAYVVDQNSTNGTFVNDVRAAANQEVKLNNGDKVSFADEEFTYSAY